MKFFLFFSQTEIRTQSSDFQGLGLKIILDTFKTPIVAFKTRF